MSYFRIMPFRWCPFCSWCPFFGAPLDGAPLAVPLWQCPFDGAPLDGAPLTVPLWYCPFSLVPLWRCPFGSAPSVLVPLWLVPLFQCPFGRCPIFWCPLDSTPYTAVTALSICKKCPDQDVRTFHTSWQCTHCTDPSNVLPASSTLTHRV